MKRVKIASTTVIQFQYAIFLLFLNARQQDTLHLTCFYFLKLSSPNNNKTKPNTTISTHKQKHSRYDREQNTEERKQRRVSLIGSS